MAFLQLASTLRDASTSHRERTNHITRAGFLDRSAPTLCQAGTCCHDPGVSQLVGVQSCACAGLKGDAGPENTRSRGRVEEQVNPHPSR
jgi:hypothetical protein